MKHRHYSAEFKREVVRRFLADEESVAQLSRRYQVHRTLIYEWWHHYELVGEAAFTDQNTIRRMAPIRPRVSREEALERLCGQQALQLERLLQENHLLKKALELLPSPPVISS